MTLHVCWTWIQPLVSEWRLLVFFWSTLVVAIFRPLPVKNNLFKFSTKFRVNKIKFLPCKCTSLLLRQTSTAKFPAFFQNFLKTVQALKVKFCLPDTKINNCMFYHVFHCKNFSSFCYVYWLCLSYYSCNYNWFWHCSDLRSCDIYDFYQNVYSISPKFVSQNWF